MILHTYGVGNVVYYPWLSGYWPSQFGASGNTPISPSHREGGSRRGRE
jgi:hypothetical protein